MPSPRAVPVPDAVLDLAGTLRSAGHEAWCVGGAVRDALLGEPSLDWDLATSATPRQVQKLFRRTVPVGVEFGTVGVLDRDGVMHEVTTFRRDVQTDGRHAVVEFGASLDDDLARRDFTINAIAYDPVDGRLHDPFDGRGDLQRRLVRAVGEPLERMVEDRLRALRALRFAARFEFALEPATWDAVVASAPHLGRLSPERVKQEIEKTLEQAERPSHAFQRWRESGAFAVLIPALGDVDDVTLGAVDRMSRPGVRGRPARRVLRLAALFSALDGRRADQALRALRFSNVDTAVVSGLAERWSTQGAPLGDAMREAAQRGESLPPDALLRRCAAAVGRTRVPGFVRLAAARWAADPSCGIAPEMVRRLHRRMVRIAYHEAIEINDLAVDGDDLRAAGLTAGPMLGRILQALLADVVAAPERNTRELLIARALDLAANGTQGANDGSPRG